MNPYLGAGPYPFFAGAGGFPFIYSRFFNDSPELQQDFLSLPEDAQQDILNSGVHSERELLDAVEQYRKLE